MRHFILITVLIFFGINICGADELKKINLDNDSIITPKIQFDSKMKIEGKGSIKVITRWPTTICLGEFSDIEIENAVLEYHAKIKSQLKGEVYLEMWVTAKKGQFFSRGLDSKISGNSDWKTIQTPFIFKKGESPDKVTLNVVINGIGTIWIDDVKLLKRD